MAHPKDPILKTAVVCENYYARIGVDPDGKIPLKTAAVREILGAADEVHWCE